MKIVFFLIIFYTACSTTFSQSKVPAPEVQIRLALLSAPEDKRDGATVMGYSPTKDFTVLRKGTNELICLADDPNQSGLSVSCYHKDLEPFMQRGRDLKKQGKNSDEVFKMREEEVKSGKLLMPKQPSTLFVYSASKEDYDEGGGGVKNGYIRSVIYIPYATAETTGLPLKPAAPGLPWIMHPGTHGAHIMINPPVQKEAVKK
ncbi:hypothetical protein [Segetibacter sp.]|uniref:hypothetical protein n=1 Tax=Segetibacter sp. TaxID=2231182 RepID=UPI00262094F2|nr:hypothetical protein [Segetibacter sp.]MCW3079371.1 hypothetical protein [Segetibacter sp.]